MIDGKWIEGLGPEQSVAEAARQVLEVRFEVVRFYLPLAVGESERDPEHVHRLRVGTRRAGAALRIFESALPEKMARRARRVLRSIRRAAGAARDWDVFVADLHTWAEKATPKNRPGLDFLIGYALGQRDAAQGELVEAGQEHEDDLKPFVSSLLQSLREPDAVGAPRRLRELGRLQLRELLRELSWAGARNLEDYEHLHQMRILGKQLRYAVEVFASSFAPPLREELYPRIEQMQEVLGLANDSHVASGRLKSLRDRVRARWPADWKRLGPGIDRLIQFHTARLPRQRDEFLAWWQTWQAQEVPRFQALLQTSSATEVRASVDGEESHE